MAASIMLSCLERNPDGHSSRDHDMIAASNQPRAERNMDIQEQHDQGLKLRVELFGQDAVEKRSNAFGEFGKPLQHIINAYAYGDVWSRSALPLATKSLAMIAMMAAAGHQNELRVHLKGALKNGCKAEEIQEVLLLLTLYCGIPAANEAHRIAAEVLREAELL
jgi:4-carboxymuconolactone decarboxylase